MLSHKNKIIELTEVCMNYDMREVLKDINLTVYDGDFIAITGPNGGGKTTLLKIILKLIKPTSGIVNYYNEAFSSQLRIGYLPQKNMIDSKFPITVKEVIESGLLAEKKTFKRFSEEENIRIDKIIEEMGVKHLENEALGNLSGGQMQRTLLGRALVANPHLLVLDEPLSYIDKQFEHQIYNIIAKIAPKTTIILVSHEMTAIAPMATRHIIIDRTLHDCHSNKHFTISTCE